MSDEGDERMLWLWTSLVGRVVTVTMKNGTEWEGLMEVKEPDSMCVVLYAARMRKFEGVRDPNAPSKFTQNLKLLATDILYVNGQVDVIEAKSIHQGPDRAGKERMLERWVGDGGELDNMELEQTGQVGAWDQFKANAQMHNYKSTYDEDIYTTKLEKNKLSKEQREAAARLAAEIEGAGRGNHDYESWADDYDEEALHSCVPRESDPVSLQQAKAATGGSYKPPHLRHNDPMATRQPAPLRPNPTPVDHHSQGHPSYPQASGRQPQPQSLEAVTSAKPNSDFQQLARRADTNTPQRIPNDCYQNNEQPQQAQPAPAPRTQPKDVSPPPPVTNTPAPIPPSLPPSVRPRGQLQSRSRAAAAQGPVKTKEEEIADLKKFAAQKFGPKKEKEPVKETPKEPVKEATTPAASGDSADQSDTPQSQKKKLNPGALPFKPTDSDVGDADSTKTAEVPFTEPEWKPQLSERATQNHTKFICKLIADGIKDRMKAKKQNNPQIIPGDSEPFQSEFLNEEQMKRNEGYLWSTDDAIKDDVTASPPQQMANQPHVPPPNQTVPYQQHHQHHQYSQHQHQYRQDPHQQMQHSGYQGGPPQGGPQGGPPHGSMQHYPGGPPQGVPGQPDMQRPPQQYNAQYQQSQQPQQWNASQHTAYQPQHHQHHHQHHHQQGQWANTPHSQPPQQYQGGGQQGQYGGYSSGYQPSYQQPGGQPQPMYQQGPQPGPGGHNVPQRYTNYSPPQGGYQQPGMAGSGYYGQQQQHPHPQSNHHDPNMQYAQHQQGHQQYPQPGSNMQGGMQGTYPRQYYGGNQQMMEGGDMMHGGYQQSMQQPPQGMNHSRRGGAMPQPNVIPPRR